MNIALTGHRSHFFPYYKEEAKNCEYQRQLILELRKAFVEKDVILVISGGCYGWDLLGAEAAFQQGIPVHAYIPFPKFGINWEERYQRQLARFKKRVEKINFVSAHYNKDCFLLRDRAMVDAADEVFAFLNPKVKRGGTYYTVNYAKRYNKPVTNFFL